jgi:hypothetical protein
MRGGRGKQMKALEGEEDRLLREIEALQNQLIGVRRAMALLRGDDPEKITLGAARKPRSPIKDAVLGLINEFKDTGLSVNEVIEIAQGRGQDLDRGSVSSLLSRLKREKVLDLDGSKYRPLQPVRASAETVENAGGPKLNLVQ